MNRCTSILALIAAASFSVAAHAQTAVTHYSQEQLAQHAKELAAKCKESGKGSCSEVLEKHPTYTVILGYRDKDGGAELHKAAADVDYVISGSCILVTGGTIQDAHSTSPTEVLGRAVEGGERTTLHQGDVVQVPAGTPHQMLLPNGGTLTYLVVKPAVPPAS